MDSPMEGERTESEGPEKSKMRILNQYGNAVTVYAVIIFIAVLGPALADSGEAISAMADSVQEFCKVRSQQRIAYNVHSHVCNAISPTRTPPSSWRSQLRSHGSSGQYATGPHTLAPTLYDTKSRLQRSAADTSTSQPRVPFGV